MIRHGTAVWSGAGKDGSGELSTQSAVLDKIPYSYKTRFGDSVGTNPEELVAVAHAGCFSMKLSIVLAEKGFTTEHLQTRCNVTFQDGRIAKSHLIVEAKIPGIDNEQFQDAVTFAAENCPISKSINADITSEAKLI
ncbi:MAG: OsmC family peroxiredoxin [Bacteroidia bacterium]